MAGPTQNFTPGYRLSTASAIRWAEECQKGNLPSFSSKVNKLREAPVEMGPVASHTSPFTFAANTFRANPSLIDFAISKPVVPSLYSRTFPSGKVILIILRLPFLG